MQGLLALLCAFLCCQACETPTDSFFVSPTSDSASHLGSQCDPFAGLQQAFATIHSDASLRLLPSSTSFGLLESVQVQHSLQVYASQQVLYLFGALTVISSASLELWNATITSSRSVHAEMFAVNGRLLLQSCTFMSGTTAIVRAYEGSVQIANCRFIENRAVGVYVAGWNVEVVMDSVEVKRHVGNFANVNPSSARGNLTWHFVNSGVTESQGSTTLFAISLPVSSSFQTANVVFAASKFSRNACPLFSFQAYRANVLLSSLSFFINLSPGILATSYLSDFQIKDIYWEKNHDLLANLRVQAGQIRLSNITIVEQLKNGLIQVAGSDLSTCSLLVEDLNATNIDIHNIVGTIGVMHASYCTASLRSTSLASVRMTSDVTWKLRALFYCEYGALLIENLYAKDSGSSSSFISSFYSSVHISHFLADNIDSPGIAISQIFGSLWVQHVTFADLGYYLMSSNRIARDLLFAVSFISVMATDAHLQDIYITNQTNIKKYDVCFAAALSNFTAEDIRVEEIVFAQMTLLMSSQGNLSDVVVTGRTDSVVLLLMAESFAQFNNLYIRLIAYFYRTSVQCIIGVNKNDRIKGSNLFIEQTQATSLIAAKASVIELYNTTILDSLMLELIGTISDSNITLIGMRAVSCTGGLGVSFSSELLLANAELRGIAGSERFIDLYSTTATFLNVTISDSSTERFGKVTQRSTLLLKNCAWARVQARTGSGWQVSDATVLITDSHFASIYSTFIYAKLAQISLKRCTFRDIRNIVTSMKSLNAYGGVLGCVDCRSVLLEEVFVQNASAMVGGALSVISQSVAGQLHISNSTFELCASSTSGGVLFLQSVSFQIDSCRFLYNKAESAGGALDLSVDQLEEKLIRNSVFRENTALEGGAIKWRNAPLVLVNVQFHYNKADYGADLASYPASLFSVAQLAVGGEVSSQSSKVPLAFEILDHYGKRVTTATNYVLTLPVPPSQVTFRGNKVSLSNKGLFQFASLMVLAPPASRQVLSVEMMWNTVNITGEVTISFRNCTSGEIYHSQWCEYCNPGNVSFFTDDQFCTRCPANAICEGGNNMTVLADHWRTSLNSSAVLVCPLKGKCLEGPTGVCAEGFAGKLCTECAQGYYRVSFVECEKCGDKVETGLLIAAIPMCILVFMGVVVCLAQKSNDVFRLYVLKAMINHAQLLSAVIPFKASYPSPIKYTLEALAFFSSFRMHDLQLACFDYSEVENIKAVLGSLTLPLLLPFTLLIASLHRAKYWQTVGILLSSCLLFTPAIATQALAFLLACEEVDSEQWLFTDMSEKCWVGTHMTLVYYLPVLSVFLNLILPLLLVTITRLLRPHTFTEYFPMWCAGQRLVLWDLLLCACKCASFWLELHSLAYTPLGQASYLFILLTVYSVISVFLHSFVYTQGFYFLLAELSTVMVICSAGLNTYYFYHAPGDSPIDVSISATFVGLNGGYFAVCFLLLVIGQSQCLQKASLPSELELGSSRAMRVPNNSYVEEAESHDKSLAEPALS